MPSITRIRLLKELSCEQWLMILAACLFVFALRCPTGRFVVYSNPEDDLVSCTSSRSTCPLPSPSSPSVLVKRVVDEDLLKKLEHDLNEDFEYSSFPLVRAQWCKSAYKTAIIVPYRNRSEHLNLFLQHMHTFLPQQNIDYSIYIVEQSKEHGFNRGKLFNIGFKEALHDADYCCFVFHDVDLLPENLQNIYACSNQPRHMCVAIDTFRYVMPYADIFGGVVAMRKDQFQKVNGFSNRFFGWGAEDDDLALRIRLNGMHITRWSPEISRYTMLSHKKAEANPTRFDLLAESSKQWRNDGLSDLKYGVFIERRTPLYTKILVNVDPPEEMVHV